VNRSERADAFRTLLIQSIQRTGATNGALCLSGGVDSASALFALLELGVKPPCYTFQLAGEPSSDVLVATSLCSSFGCVHRIVTIPRDWDVAVADTKRVLQVIQTAQKTHVQCSIPLVYVAEQMRRDGHGDALMAMAIGDAWGTSRKPQEVLHAQGEYASMIDRRRHVTDPNLSDYSIINAVRALTGVALIDVTRDDHFLELLLTTRMAHLHRPQQKQIALDAFHRWWRQGQWYRRNSSMQLNSGLRDFYGTLLDAPYNARGHMAIVGLYNQWLNEINGTDIDGGGHAPDQRDDERAPADREAALSAPHAGCAARDGEKRVLAAQ
jgi:hypothetical protein